VAADTIPPAAGERLPAFTADPLSGKKIRVGERDSTERAGLRVLLVEDDPDHAELVRRGLEDYGSRLELTHLEDGEAALEYLHLREPRDAPGRPHLILLDLRLPRIDGLEVLREIKASPDLCEIPCVVLTTSQAEGDMVKAYRLHANSYLVKPGDYERFVELIAGAERYWLQQNSPPARGE
jgi:CheY-like chemotaxis protein